MRSAILMTIVFWLHTSVVLAQDDTALLETDTAVANMIVPNNTLKYIIDIPVIDLPANTNQGGLAVKQFSPSMEQSLRWSLSYTELREYYTKRLFFNPAKKHSITGTTFRVLGIGLIESLIGLAGEFPLGAAWMHEEWHRAVMNNNNVRSHNDVNYMKVGPAQVIAVSHETDADMALFKKNNSKDFVRMQEAGIEAQYQSVKALQKDNFYYRTNLYSQFYYLFNIYSSVGYVQSCSTKEGDDINLQMEREEGANIPARDFTGMDMIGWVYDLSRPGEPYASRGVHPSGVGVRRYRLTTDLTGEELGYLEKMGRMQYLNYITPHLFFINSIKINKDLRVNAALFHLLTSFGYDAGCNFFADYKNEFYFFAVHTYHNLHNSFYGIEAQVIDHPFTLHNHKLLLSPCINIWTQPRDQEFRTAKSELGGRAELKVAMNGSVWRPYITLSAKTNGWVAGDVFLNSNFSGRLGVSAFVR